MLHIAGKSYKMGRRDERMELMKDAVNGRVCKDVYAESEPYYYVESVCCDDLLEKNDLYNGDKVKVIILKEEDEK